MTVTPAERVYRHLRETGYVSATPVRVRLQEFRDAGVIEYRLARHLGVTPRTLSFIRCGTQTLTHQSLAQAILAMTAEEAVTKCARPEPHADTAAVTRLLTGHNVQIPAHDKPAYARALHTHGWTKTKISTVLHMSGASVNQALRGAAA